MKKYPIVLDLETKYTFRDFNKHKKLGISVIGIYDYEVNSSKIFTEEDLSQLFPVLENASYIVGFNIKSFDMQVLQAYYPGDVSRFSIFDICDDIKDKIGKRLALNDLLYATLGKKKNGHGLIAINLYKQGKFDELKNYCLSDVTLTTELFDYGVEKGIVCYFDDKGKKEIAVDWKRYMEDSNHRDTHLTLPF